MKHWKQELPEHYKADTIPKQLSNGGDCGLFTILFVESLACYMTFSSISQTIITKSKFCQRLAKLLLTFKADFPIEVEDNDNI